MRAKHNYSDLTKGKYKVSGLKLMTTNSLKTIKSLELGILSGILYLSPYKSGGARIVSESSPLGELGEHGELGEISNLCPFATKGCISTCLYTSGASIMFTKVNKARRRKTKELIRDPAAFASKLARDIAKIVRAAERKIMIPTIRLNGTSDLRWERIAVEHNGERFASIMEAFPAVQFYDYTKRTDRSELPANYALTFSRSGENDSECYSMLERGINVAVVFAIQKKDPLPDRFMGYPVIDGDRSDTRFLDPSPAIVGLRAKGKARGRASLRRDRVGFIIRSVA